MRKAAAAHSDSPHISFKPGEFFCGGAGIAAPRSFAETAELKKYAGRICTGVLMRSLHRYPLCRACYDLSAGSAQKHLFPSGILFLCYGFGFIAGLVCRAAPRGALAILANLYAGMYPGAGGCPGVCQLMSAGADKRIGVGKSEAAAGALHAARSPLQYAVPFVHIFDQINCFTAVSN
jgi:hypothetical protein